MKVHKVTLLIIDFDGVGEDNIADIVQEANYPNGCISPDVIKIETVEIGEWNDDNPLNKEDTRESEINRLFP
jgi:hypothetical protein